MGKRKLKRWVKVLITIIFIHLNFFIWRQTGVLGELAQTSKVYVYLCVGSWFYLIFGQILIIEKIWK